MAEKTYTENGYTYTVDDNGTVTAKGTVSENPASRKGMSSIHPDGYDSKTDDKGHLIAAREGGVAADYNVSAQDRGLNRGAYKTVENAEVELANKGYTVETEKTAYVSNPGDKPSAYMVSDKITTPDGKVHTVHSSFTNMSKAEHEETNATAATMPVDNVPNPDPARESMTPEEYNQIMEETEEQLGSVKDEYDIDNTISTQPSNEEGVAAKDSTEPGVHDNDAEDFDGVTPSLALSESSSVHDNDAEDFDGTAPSLDSSVSSDAGVASDEGFGASADDGLGTTSDEGSDSGNSAEDGADTDSGTDGGSDDGEGLD